MHAGICSRRPEYCLPLLSSDAGHRDGCAAARGRIHLQRLRLLPHPRALHHVTARRKDEECFVLHVFFSHFAFISGAPWQWCIRELQESFTVCLTSPASVTFAHFFGCFLFVIDGDSSSFSTSSFFFFFFLFPSLFLFCSSCWRTMYGGGQAWVARRSAPWDGCGCI